MGSLKTFFGNVYPGKFRRSLTNSVFLLGQIVRYHKSSIFLRIKMGSNQKIIDLWYLKLKIIIDVLK